MYDHIFQLHAELFKALAHRRRLEIIYLLQDQKLSVSEICNALHFPQANISQHLTLLRKTKIVIAERKAKQVFYSLSNKNIIKACNLLRKEQS